MSVLNQILTWLAKVKTNPQVNVQGDHFFIGYIVAMTTAYFHGPLLLFCLIANGIFALIESLFDPKYEGAPFFWNGATDLLFYTLGLWIGYGLTYA